MKPLRNHKASRERTAVDNNDKDYLSPRVQT